MGEIGIDRHTFLYELQWWEVNAIIRGYNARHHHSWEQARMISYFARYAMGSKDTPPPINEWIKFPWEVKVSARISQAEVKELQELMDNVTL